MIMLKLSTICRGLRALSESHIGFISHFVVPQSRSGGKPLQFQVVCTQHGTASLKGSIVLVKRDDSSITAKTTHVFRFYVNLNSGTKKLTTKTMRWTAHFKIRYPRKKGASAIRGTKYSVGTSYVYTRLCGYTPKPNYTGYK